MYGDLIHLLLCTPQLVLDWVLARGVKSQAEAFREGFNSVFPLKYLHVFQPHEVSDWTFVAIEHCVWKMLGYCTVFSIHKSEMPCKVCWYRQFTLIFFQSME